MNIQTHYGTVYGVATLEQAQAILAASHAEMEHEACPVCRGVLSLAECSRENVPALVTVSEVRA